MTELTPNENRDQLAPIADQSILSPNVEFIYDYDNLKQDLSLLMKGSRPSTWLDNLICCYYVTWVYIFGRLCRHYMISEKELEKESAISAPLFAIPLGKIEPVDKRFVYERQFFADQRWKSQTGKSWRPIVYLGMLFFPLVVLVWMLVHFSREAIAQIRAPKELPLPTGCDMIIRQNKEEVREPAAFFFSSAFPVAAMAIYFVGLPAAIALMAYNSLGIDALVGLPSTDPNFFTVFVIIDLYIYSLSWCLCVLFFRSYFTFPWNFLSYEYDIAVYPDVIMQSPIKGWFSSVATVNCESKTLKWEDINSITLEGNTKISLRDLSERQTNPIVRKMVAGTQKVLELQESMADRLRSRDTQLYLRSNVDTMGICLDDMTDNEKRQLFFAIKNHAPSVHLNEKVQEALVGTKVLNDPRYTELWFDILAHGIPEQASADLEIGKSLSNDRFRIVEKIRTGGEAIAYLAETKDGDTVVLKRFQLKGGESISSFVQSAASFENESAMLSQLDDPRIVKLKEFFLEENSAYLCLEHVKGNTLRESVSKNGAMQDAQVMAIAKELCEVLKYLHERTPPIVHRDISPDNIIVMSTGEVKLIDFSVAEQREEKQTTNCAGKHAYTPPEQFRGEACPASDLYALGGVIYFMLSGRDPVPISQIEPHEVEFECSQALKEVMKQATALDLDERYASADWMLAELIHKEESSKN